jgi:hypothetical protein
MRLPSRIRGPLATTSPRTSNDDDDDERVREETDQDRWQHAAVLVRRRRGVPSFPFFFCLFSLFFAFFHAFSMLFL